jgi:hypothetical protein
MSGVVVLCSVFQDGEEVVDRSYEVCGSRHERLAELAPHARDHLGGEV